MVFVQNVYHFNLHTQRSDHAETLIAWKPSVQITTSTYTPSVQTTSTCKPSVQITWVFPNRRGNMTTPQSTPVRGGHLKGCAPLVTGHSTILRALREKKRDFFSRNAHLFSRNAIRILRCVAVQEIRRKFRSAPFPGCSPPQASQRLTSATSKPTVPWISVYLNDSCM